MIKARDILKEYNTLEPVGFGARSIIYKARRKSDNEVYAIKFVPVRIKSDLRVIRHLENEYSVLCRVNQDQQSDHIVRPETLCRRRKVIKTIAAYLVMEYLEGESLQDSHDYSIGQLLQIFKQVCRGLLYLHRHGYVHGDVKPDNIIVNSSLETKIIDLGFSVPIGTPVRGLKGTIGYLAPEQVGGTLQPETDIFNFGATMYWLTTGEEMPHLMVENGNSKQIPDIGLPVAPPVKLNPQIPVELSDLIHRCCDSDPSERPPMRVVNNVLTDMAMHYELGLR